jgi:pumilio RNA-binding family
LRYFGYFTRHFLAADGKTVQNYVIQFVLEHGKAADREHIIARLRGQVIYMARHKFASNVCEKALLFSDPETRKKLVDEIISSPPGVNNPMATMMKDQFASK